MKANYSSLEGFNSLKFSLSSSLSRDISIINFSTINTVDYIVPKTVISNNLTKSELLKSLSDKLLLNLPTNNVKVGLNYFSNSINYLYNSYPETLMSYNDHILLQENKTRIKGLDLGIKISLDAVFGAGIGLTFGLKGSYFDEMHYPKSESIFAHGKLLPLSEYNDISDDFTLSRFADELSDLFSGAIALVKETLKELVKATEYFYQEGIHFIFGGDKDSEYKIEGTLANAGRIIVRILDPTTKTIQKGLFLDPKIITAYSSDRLIYDNIKGVNLYRDQSTLYIVSQNAHVSFLDNYGTVMSSFNPVYLSLGIDPVKTNELTFGENEKKLAKMYYHYCPVKIG